MNTPNTVRPKKPPHILLIEPDNLVRGTLAGVCRDLGLARVHQATSVAAATDWLGRRDLQGILVALDDEGAAMKLLASVRAGEFACPAQLVVAVMSSSCTVETAKSLKALDVMRFLLQPFKLRDAILTLEQMGVAARALDAPADFQDSDQGEGDGVDGQGATEAEPEAESAATSEAQSA